MKRPSLYFTEEHTLFRLIVRQFIEKEVIPNTEAWETNRRIPISIFKRMGQLGYLGLPFPEEFGGAEADFWYSVVFLEELARCGMGGFATAVSVHEYMAINHIFKAGSYDLKQRYLRPAIAGEKVAALAITEPDAGSDVSAMRPTAVRTQKGDGFIVNGAKTFISNGTYGDFVALVVKTNKPTGDGAADNRTGISLLVVDLDSPGITRTKLNKIGWHSSDTAEIWFDEVHV